MYRSLGFRQIFSDVLTNHSHFGFIVKFSMYTLKKIRNPALRQFGDRRFGDQDDSATNDSFPPF